MKKKNVINELELILRNYTYLYGKVENEEGIIQQVSAWGKERTLQELEDIQNGQAVLCLERQRALESLNKEIIFKKEELRKRRIFKEDKKNSLIDKSDEEKKTFLARLFKIIVLPLIIILGVKSYFLWEFCDISREVVFMDVGLNTLLVIVFSYLYYVCTSKIQKKKLIDERIAEDEAKLQSMKQRALNIEKELEGIEDFLQKLEFYFFEEVKNSKEENTSKEENGSD